MLVQFLIILLVAVTCETMSLSGVWEPLIEILGHHEDNIENKEELYERLYKTIVAALETSETCLERLLCQLGVPEVVEKSLGGKMALTMASYYTDGSSHHRWSQAIYNILENTEWTDCLDIPCGKLHQVP